MAARCRKFVPNLFNKTKCQSCFGAKEAHTAEALESSKAARKISKCTYLFVSPDLDFSNPLHRSKRWQRRFFILYDDGELTYSVDDNPGTIPQGSVDMNKCTDVFDAEEKTSHEYSIGITVPNQPSSYVKGTSKDEIQRWFDVLVMYPRSLTIKTKRIPGSKPGSPVNADVERFAEVDYTTGGGGVSRHLSYYPAGTEKSVSDDEDADSVHSKDSSDTYERSGRTRGRYKQRDMRRSKSEVRPSDLRLAEDEYNKKTGEGTVPSASQTQSKFSKDKNLDGLPVRKAGEPETFSSVRSMKHRKAAKSQQQHGPDASKAQHSSSAAPADTSDSASGVTLADSSSSPLNRRLSTPNISTVPKPVSGHKSVGRTASAAESSSGAAFSAFVYPPATSTPSNALTNANETDEHKIAKNEHARKSMEKSPIVRKGWLLVRQDIQTNVWSKHWFVLCGTSLSYYKDAKAEDTNQLDGVIDVANAYEVSTVKAERNHGFKIKTKEGEYVLSAMTSGIRRNWIDAVEGIIAEIRRAREKSARQDMGFVFESPIRSPRTPSATTSNPSTVTPIAPVVPDSTSRVNSTLRSKHAGSRHNKRREMAERRRETGDDRPLEELYDIVSTKERKDSACSETEREVLALTSNQDSQVLPAAAHPLSLPTDVAPQPPKSPTAFVSPSQRIKEKSRSKTPPRARSPPPPVSATAPSRSTSQSSATHSTSPSPHSTSPSPHSSSPSPHSSSPHNSSPYITAPQSTSRATKPHSNTPLATSSHSSMPLGSIPLGSIPLGSTPLGSTPLGSNHSSHSSTPVDRVLLLPTGNSSDENDDSLSVKLLQSNKQVQQLQQQVEDVNSTVRKQRVEIESIQTKLDLTTSQLRDMETALTQSSQNLNKERRNTCRLTEALEALKRDHPSEGYQQRCALLERQLQDATHKLATQEVKMGMVNSLEEQLQIRTSKLATLEKVLGNTRRHLQDAVENVRETELHYQTKIEEVEHDYEDERVELQEKLHKMEERLDSLVTESNNSVNTELSGQLMKEKSQNVQRLEELVKEQKGKIDQLTEENTSTRQLNDELQCYKDRAAVNQNQLDTVQQEFNLLHTEFESLRHNSEGVNAELAVKDSQLVSKCQENARLMAYIDELQERCQQSQGQGHHLAGDDLAKHEIEALTLEFNNALESSRGEIESLQHANAELVHQLQMSNVQVQSLKESCRNVELELKKEKSKPAAAPVPPPVATPSAAGGFTLAQVVELIGAVARCCERMTESAVAMLAGEMIETDIKATINFNQEQRGALGNKTAEQLSKKFAGIRQRLNYIVKRSVSKKQFDNLHSEKEGLVQRLSAFEASGSQQPRVERLAETGETNSDYLSALLEQCRAEILCISTDITRLDISQVETRLHTLNTALSQLDKRKISIEFSADSSVESYCNKLAVQAAAMFELARSITDGVDVVCASQSIENCLKSTSGVVTSIEDLALRNYALLVSERLLISHELDHLILTGQWKGFMDGQSEEFTTKALVSETLQRIDVFSLSRGQPLNEIFLNSCLNNLLQQNIGGSPSLDTLRTETSLISSLFKSIDQSLAKCVREYVLLYTSELVNFGTAELGEVESLVANMTKKLSTRIKQLSFTGNLSSLCTGWLHQQICDVCDRVKGLEPKDIPMDMGELALKVCMFESKFNASSSLIMKRQTSTLSQSLVSEACKLAGLSAELAKKSASPGSTEEKIASLAHRLERTDRLLTTCTIHYSDGVQQVMREVVNNMQSSLLRHLLGSGGFPASAIEQSLTQEVEDLSLKLKLANQRTDKLVNINEHEKAVGALTDEMSLLKVEHSTELDESKRDMKMVLKSVKAEEYRMATELTKRISELESRLAEEQRAHQATEQKLQQCRPDSVPLEEHAVLKDKVRDLENCLHEMQEEFEEELYQERRAHLAELDKCRAELLSVIGKADNQQLVSQDVREQYKVVIDKLKAEQASLQQWIDDIREAHRDEMDALQHERDDALADEMMSTQSALEAMRSTHAIELEQGHGKVKEQEEKASRLIQVERDLLLYTRDNENKEERIGALNSKVSAVNKKLAKLEMNSVKSTEVINELTALNKQLTERNIQLVERFTQEMSNVSSKGSAPSSSQHLALRAQVDTLSEKLRLELLGKSQLEDEIESLKASYEHQLQQREEDAKLEVSVSVSPAEEMLLRRKLRVRSPSPHVRHSSPPVFARAASPKSIPSNNNTDMVVDHTKPPNSSPRKISDKPYDLSRSKSAASVGKQTVTPRSKRLSDPDKSPRPVMLDTNDRGFQQYQKSGGMSIADRMRKFT